MTYFKMLFFGPPRSGKSSTRRRLIREIINLRALGRVSPSTGVAESKDVIIKKLTSISATITNSEWSAITRQDASREMESKGDVMYLAQLFYQLISKKGPTAIGQSTTDTRQSQDSNSPLNREQHTNIPTQLSPFPPSTKALVERLSETEKSDVEDALKKLTKILQSNSPKEFQQLLEELAMMNMIDVGGQPAFLEMLPTLAIGPALYLLFFRLDQELRKLYPVRFLNAGSKEDTLLETSYCIEDVLNQSLSTIACFSQFSSVLGNTTAPRQQSSSVALLFGTYKDQVDSVQMSEIDNELKKKLYQTNLQKELLLRKSRDELFFAIDNMDGDDSEMDIIRKSIEGIIEQHFPKIKIPASWLMFRILLHLLGKPVVTMTLCRELACRVSMPTSDVQDAVWFFHHKVGSLMHYPEIPSMKDTVICDPQVIFDSISELIIDTFKIEDRAIPASVVDDFHENGQFSLEHIAHRTMRTHLSIKQLVYLLKHLNILAEINCEEKHPQSQSKYIIPAVLKCASEEELKLQTPVIPEEQACSLLIHFKCGFVPFGVFCAGVAHLIAHQDSLSLKYSLCTSKGHEVRNFRNKATFLVDGTFLAHLISRPQYIEVQVHRPTGTRKKKSSLTDICCKVRRTIIETLETVIFKMKYKAVINCSGERPFHLSFPCCLENSHSDHLMEVVDDGEDRYAICSQYGREVELKGVHQKWFEVHEVCVYSAELYVYYVLAESRVEGKWSTPCLLE